MSKTSPQPNLRQDRLPAVFWGLVVITGIGTGLGSALLMELLHAVQHVAWSYVKGDFMSGVEHSTVWRRIGVLTAAGLFAGICRKLLRSPGHKGHAGDLSEAIWMRDGKIPVLPMLGSSVVSIMVVGLGASLGREGALKQTGGAIGSLLSRWRGLPPSQRRLLVACGAGAGMAAAYNVPFGGALFVLEVLLGTMALPVALPALTTSIIATVVSWTMLPNRPTYIVSTINAPVSLIVWALIAGPVMGLAAAGYIRFISWADAHRSTRWHIVTAPWLVFTAMGIAAVWFPQILGNGKDMVQQLIVGGTAPRLIPPLLALKTLAVAGCLASGAPGGLFTPTITCGALLGRVLGLAWQLVWPGAPPGTFALVGAGVLLAASTQGPVSAVVLLVELTHRVDSMVVPLLLAMAGAMLVTRTLEERSIYTARIYAQKTVFARRMAAGGSW